MHTTDTWTNAKEDIHHPILGPETTALPSRGTTTPTSWQPGIPNLAGCETGCMEGRLMARLDWRSITEPIEITLPTGLTLEGHWDGSYWTYQLHPGNRLSSLDTTTGAGKEAFEEGMDFACENNLCENHDD